MDEKKKEEQEKRANEGMGSIGGLLTGLLFVSAIESYFLGALDDCFNGFIPIWRELPSFLGGLLAITIMNYLVACVGMVIYGRINALLHGEGKIWAVIRAVVAIAAAVLFSGIVFQSCGRFGV